MCQNGARPVHNQSSSRINSDGLKVFVVWTPRYPGDNRAKAVAATCIVPDSRATHYWDADGRMSKQNGKQFAWDTYMLFDSKADWIPIAAEPH